LIIENMANESTADAGDEAMIGQDPANLQTISEVSSGPSGQFNIVK